MASSAAFLLSNAVAHASGRLIRIRGGERRIATRRCKNTATRCPAHFVLRGGSPHRAKYTSKGKERRGRERPGGRRRGAARSSRGGRLFSLLHARRRRVAHTVVAAQLAALSRVPALAG